MNITDLNFVCAGESYSTYQKNVPAPIFRKIFQLSNKPDSADLTIGATGFYELYLNGERITKGYLAPFISNPDQIIFFDKYNLTDLLQNGENVIDVLLGNGFCNPIGGEIWGHTRRCEAPAFALHFNCGNINFSAEDMMWKPSHILFDDYRIGVFCDMRKMRKGVSAPEFEGEWQPSVPAHGPKGERKYTSCEPVREIRRIHPQEIRQGALRDYRMRDIFSGRLFNGDTVMGKAPVNGGYIYDFGENNAGVPCLKIKGTYGQRIDLQFSELMFEGFVDYINVDVYPDGCCQHDVYICGSDEEEIYIPPFTYHGFRYCYVYGITEQQATEALLEFVVLHNDVPVRSSFECSDEISNRIFEACCRSDESNLMNIITDCPTREKNGWTGDIAVSADHYMFHLGVENCLKDWLSCVRFAQDKRGNLPLVVPSTDGADNCPIWDSVLFLAPYAIYVYTGDTAVITENADSMMKNLHYYISLCDERGIVECGLGDWLPVGLQPGEYNSPLGYCCSVILMEVCRIGEVMMRCINRTEDADYCSQQHAMLRTAVRREYNDCGIITGGKTEKYRKPFYRICQTSQALGLYAGVFDDIEKSTALNCLLNCIDEKNNSFDCGFLGLRTVFYVLSDNGYADLAYRMITHPEHPSYANMIYRGETTVWERFMAPGKRIGSHNHHFMADVSAWYLRCVAGINVNPEANDPDHILVAPQFIKSLTYVRASYYTPHGSVGVKWQRKNEKIFLYIEKSGAVTVEYSENIHDKNIVCTEKTK